MKLLVNKTICKERSAVAIAAEFYCKTEVQEAGLIITKNLQLSESEFSVLAGKLVMAGFKVELIW